MAGPLGAPAITNVPLGLQAALIYPFFLAPCNVASSTFALVPKASSIVAARRRPRRGPSFLRSFWRCSTTPPRIQKYDFYDLCGLQRPANRVRLFVLCPDLRQASSGLRDIEAPLDQLQRLNVRQDKALVVENQEIAYSLPDFERTVALVKLGNAVSLAAQMPWMLGVPVVYGGYIDSHGLAILAQARKALDAVTSILMDEQTMVGHRDRRVQEQVLNRAADRAALQDECCYRS